MSVLSKIFSENHLNILFLLKSSKMNISTNNFVNKIKISAKKKVAEKRKMKVFRKNLHKIRILQIYSQKFPIRLTYSLGISP
jgi:hypothetical protein